MKTIGILGGMSFESTQSYLRIMAQEMRHRLGGLHSPEVALVSLDFAPVEALQAAGDWDRMARELNRAARQVQAAGADFLLIATNTMHKVALEVQAGLSIPLLHIADATARRLTDHEVTRVGLLGTRFTMEEDFYKGRLADRFGLEVLVPNAAARGKVHEIIYQELCQGLVREDSRQHYVEVVDDLAARGAEAVILGCTEIALLIGPEHTAVPLFDTARIHAEAAVEMALAD